MYIITEISRAHSSGYENSYKKIFDTLEETVEWIQNQWYPGFCIDYDFPDSWDAEDMECSFPSKDEFSLEKIKQRIEKKRNNIVIFGPFSKYCQLVPNELILDIVKR